MQDPYITLWYSKTLAQKLGRQASPQSGAVLDLETGRTISYNRAGQLQADFGRGQNDMWDAENVYDGLRDNLVLILVGDTTPTGYVTMAGTPLTREQEAQVDEARQAKCKARAGLPFLPIAGTQSPEAFAAEQSRQATARERAYSGYGSGYSTQRLYGL